MATKEGLAILDVTAWGWATLIWGALLVLAGVGLLGGASWARWLAIVGVGVNAVEQTAFLANYPNAYPLWNILIIALDVLVLYALTARWEGFRDAQPLRGLTAGNAETAEALRPQGFRRRIILGALWITRTERNRTAPREARYPRGVATGSTRSIRKKGENPMKRFTAARPVRAGLLVVAAVAAAAFLLVTPAVGAPPQVACDHADEQHLRQAARVRPPRRRPRAPGRLAGDRRRERRHARRRDSGYDASVDYVVETLEAAGWTVSLDEFDFTVAEPIQRTAPTPATFDSSGVTGSALGTVTAAGDPRRHQPDSSAGKHERMPGSVHGGRSRGAAHG